MLARSRIFVTKRVLWPDVGIEITKWQRLYNGNGNELRAFGIVVFTPNRITSLSISYRTQNFESSPSLNITSLSTFYRTQNFESSPSLNITKIFIRIEMFFFD